jgi:hypothetical protein
MKSGDNEEWFRLYFLRESVPDFEPKNWNLLTEFSWMHDSLGDLFAASKARHEAYGPGYYLYLAGMRKSNLYVEHRFVNLIWALESLHWQKEAHTRSVSDRVRRILGKFTDVSDKRDLRWLKGKLKHADEPALEERIFDSFTALPLKLDRESLRGFSKRCAERRNQISHTGGPGKGEAYRDFSDDLTKLTKALGYLHHALLLHEIGLDGEHLELAMTKTMLAQRLIVPAMRDVGLFPETPKEQ